ncbi:MAG TPA: CapA family protein [Dermatophilaceae bacterium]|nr:CapA family protein [Dermatophilaceae bacterium]
MVGRVRLVLSLAAAALMTSACTGGGPAAAPSAAGVPTTPAPTTAAATGSTYPEPAVTTARPATLTVVAGGDVLLHTPTWEQADRDAGRAGDGRLDFLPQLRRIADLVSGADLALCHMETPVGPSGGPYASYPSFAVPPVIATALAQLGFDACSQASNHTFDQGLGGVRRTADALARAGITSYGATVGNHPGNPTLVTVAAGTRAVKVGLLSYTYGFNGAVPSGGASVAEVVSPGRVRAEARTARRLGAEIVIASVHWGTEYEHEPNAMQRDLAAQLARLDDLDLVIGHHAHVVQPFALVRGTWVAYGLGNMIAAQSTAVPANAEGVLAQFTFVPDGSARWKVTRAAYQPTFIDRSDGVRLVRLPQDRSQADSPAERARYDLAERRTRSVVTSLGAPAVEITAAR